MLREKQNIYENRKLHHVRPEKIRTRDQKRAIASIQRYREESETLRLRLKLTEQTEPENARKQAGLQQKLAESEELLALAEQIYAEYQKDMDSLPQRRVHIRRKKQNPEKLYRSVLLLIQEAKAAGINGLTKEETARKLNCPEYQVEQVFMRLTGKESCTRPSTSCPTISTETYSPTAVFPAGYQTGTNFVPIPIYEKEETYVLIIIPIHAPAQRTTDH